jgi:signal transduction histidine kinase
VIEMPFAVNQMTAAVEPGVLCGIADPELAQGVCREIEARQRGDAVCVAENLSQLMDHLVAARPKVILLDGELVMGAPLAEFLGQLNEIAPVVLIASIDRHKEIAKFVVEGKVEFVGRYGDCASLAASLVLRHLQGPEAASRDPHSPGVPDNVAEIFRHDINNPLTGILGNAELVLSHGSKMPPADVQRLQTVVELAVRLRETIRQLSDAWEAQSQSLKSA